MANYKKNGTDLANIIELFPRDIGSQTIVSDMYHDKSVGDGVESCIQNTSAITVTESQFTGTGKYKIQGNQIPMISPSLQGSTYLGGNHVSPIANDYKQNGNPANSAEIGCRPIGIKLKQIETPGTYYISRKDGKTYFSTSSTVGSGELLHPTYNPKYIIVEVQGAGGGGGGASLSAGGQGGCGGAYFACGLYIDPDTPIVLTVGAGGRRGESHSDGGNGGNSTLSANINGSSFTLIATAGHFGKRSTGDNSSFSDTPVNVPDAPANSDKFVLLAACNGSPGAGKDTDNGYGNTVSFQYPKPETQTIKRGPFRNGYTDSWTGQSARIWWWRWCQYVS